jgi:hypothetical protein
MINHQNCYFTVCTELSNGQARNFELRGIPECAIEVKAMRFASIAGVVFQDFRPFANLVRGREVLIRGMYDGTVNPLQSKMFCTVTFVGPGPGVCGTCRAEVVESPTCPSCGNPYA